MNQKHRQLLKNHNFIIFGEDFNRHPHALEHLLRPLFSENKFIWVETIGLRSPRLSVYDLNRIFQKLLKWMKLKKTAEPASEIPKNVHIITPFMIPLNQYDLIRKINTISVNYCINKKMKALHFKNIISIASVPNAADYIGNYNEKSKIYFCVDEFSLWPGLDYKLVSKLEKLLIEKADQIIATSYALSTTKTKNNKLTSIIGHGVDFEHFNIGPKQFSDNKIKVCYFGLFDERSDQELLYNIAKSLPNVNIEIIGEVVCDISLIKEISNISFIGKCQYMELPSRIKDYDIFILPYKLNELTKNINPLKLKEYLATSRLVISTPLPEVIYFKEYLKIAHNSDEFIIEILDYIKNPSAYNPQKTIEYIRENETWNAKALILSHLIK